MGSSCATENHVPSHKERDTDVGTKSNENDVCNIETSAQCDTEPIV